MLLALVQTHPVLGERLSNLEGLAETVQSVEADLYCFPELCTTGYAIDKRQTFLDLAEESDSSPGMKFFRKLSEEKNAAVMAGFPLREGGNLFNASGLFRPGKEPIIYRKLHLFAREKQIFDPGGRLPEVVEFRGVRLGMMICFDWIFPEMGRLLALAGADLILHPSNLVTPYCQKAMFARAVENSVFIATVNRVGTEIYSDGQSLSFTGGTQLMGHRGEVLLELPAEGIAAAVVDFDPRVARDKWLTHHNHVLEDRRSELFDPLCEDSGREG
jgi:predicted amidohydrolase